MRFETGVDQDSFESIKESDSTLRSAHLCANRQNVLRFLEHNCQTFFGVLDFFKNT